MKIEIEFAYTLTGKVLADFTVDYCKTLANAAVSQTSMTLTEIAFGVYVLDNPNVVVDTILRMHLTSDATQYITTKFSLSDGNTALETTGNVAAIKTKTDYLPSVTAGATNGISIVGSAQALTSAYDFAKGTVAMTEAYSVDGAAATPAQILHMIWSMLAEKSVTSTIVTCKKLDGTTGAMTFTLNNASNPTTITRSS